MKSRIAVSVLAAVLILTLCVGVFVACDPTTPETPKSYTLSFDIGYDGGENPQSLTVEEGKTATLPAAPEREGYKFDGWYLGGEGDALEGSATVTVTADATYVAKWTIKQLTASFDPGTYQGEGKMPASELVNYDEQLTLPACDLVDGENMFLGWKQEGDDTLLAPGAKFTMRQDAKFIAQWGIPTAGADQLLVKIQDGEGKLIKYVVLNNHEILGDDLPTAPEIEGKYLLGWFVYDTEYDEYSSLKVTKMLHIGDDEIFDDILIYDFTETLVIRAKYEDLGTKATSIDSKYIGTYFEAFSKVVITEDSVTYTDQNYVIFEAKLEDGIYENDDHYVLVLKDVTPDAEYVNPDFIWAMSLDDDDTLDFEGDQYYRLPDLSAKTSLPAKYYGKWTAVVPGYYGDETYTLEISADNIHLESDEPFALPLDFDAVKEDDTYYLIVENEEYPSYIVYIFTEIDDTQFNLQDFFGDVDWDFYPFGACTVTFEGANVEPMKALADTQITLPTAPDKKNPYYRLTGWKKADGTILTPNTQFTVTENITLTAVWTAFKPTADDLDEGAIAVEWQDKDGTAFYYTSIYGENSNIGYLFPEGDDIPEVAGACFLGFYQYKDGQLLDYKATTNTVVVYTGEATASKFVINSGDSLVLRAKYWTPEGDALGAGTIESDYIGTFVGDDGLLKIAAKTINWAPDSYSNFYAGFLKTYPIDGGGYYAWLADNKGDEGDIVLQITLGQDGKITCKDISDNSEMIFESFDTTKYGQETELPETYQGVWYKAEGVSIFLTEYTLMIDEMGIEYSIDKLGGGTEYTTVTAYKDSNNVYYIVCDCGYSIDVFIIELKDGKIEVKSEDGSKTIVTLDKMG